jgi:hypothetical protein
MEKESSGQRPVEANSTGSQGSRRAVAPNDDDEFVVEWGMFQVELYIIT